MPEGTPDAFEDTPEIADATPDTVPFSQGVEEDKGIAGTTASTQDLLKALQETADAGDEDAAPIEKAA